MKVIDDERAPVYVSPSFSPNTPVELRIGPEEPGKTHFAWLSVSQARLLAFTLLMQAEKTPATRQT